jgi:hypothetical protein
VFTIDEVSQGLLLPLIARSLPDFGAVFERTAADLVAAAEAATASPRPAFEKGSATLPDDAGVAQRQSSCFVNSRLRVRFLSPAPVGVCKFGC